MRSFLTLLNSWLILSCLLCGSCTHYYYAPEEGNLLAINESGDLKASGSIGTAFSDYGNNNSYSFQLGFSPLKSLAFQGSFYHVNHFYQNALVGNLYMASGAVGYYHFKEFKKLNEEAGERDPKRGLIFDAYLGYGVGDAYNVYDGGGRASLIYNKTYLQGGVHWQGKVIGMSLVGRLVRLDYDKARLSGNIDNSQWFIIEQLSEFNPYTIIETSSRVHAGNKFFKIYFSQAMVFPQFFDAQIDYLVKSFSIGIVVDIDSAFEKKSSKKKKKKKR